MLDKLIGLIYRFFIRKEKNIEPEPEPQYEENSFEETASETANPDDSPQSIVSFLATSKGNIDLNITWGENDEVAAKNLAAILFLVNSGAFEAQCAELLVQMAEQNPSIMRFVRLVIIEWNALKATKPIIKPSEVFRFGTIGTRE